MKNVAVMGWDPISSGCMWVTDIDRKEFFASRWRGKQTRDMQLASHCKQNKYWYQAGSSKGGFYTGIGNLHFHRAEMRNAPYIKYSYAPLWNEE